MKIGAYLIFVYWLGTVFVHRKDLARAKWLLFLTAVFVSTFVNLGNAFTLKMNFSYSIMAQGLYLLTCLMEGGVKFLKNERIERKLLVSVAALLGSVFIGFLLLLAQKGYPPVITMSVLMDDVFFGKATATVPRLSHPNYAALASLILFIAVVLASREYFLDEGCRMKMRRSFLCGFRIFFVLIAVEFALNNLVSPSLLRNATMYAFGEPSRGYTQVQMRNNLYTVMLLFSEPSYVVVTIAYYMLSYTQKNWHVSDTLWLLASVIALVVSGASSGIYLLPMAALVFAEKVLGFTRSSAKRWLWAGAALLAGIGFAALSWQTASGMLRSALEKAYAYFVPNVQNGYLSGNIRQFGNQYAYNAFLKTPAFGVGLGTTRGYGIIPGMLACLGVVGTLSYCVFIKTALAIRLNRAGALMLCAFVVYGTSILSVWYLYEPMILMVFLSISSSEKPNSVQKPAGV